MNAGPKSCWIRVLKCTFHAGLLILHDNSGRNSLFDTPFTLKPYINMYKILFLAKTSFSNFYKYLLFQLGEPLASTTCMNSNRAETEEKSAKKWKFLFLVCQKYFSEVFFRKPSRVYIYTRPDAYLGGAKQRRPSFLSCFWSSWPVSPSLLSSQVTTSQPA